MEKIVFKYFIPIPPKSLIIDNVFFFNLKLPLLYESLLIEASDFFSYLTGVELDVILRCSLKCYMP